MDVYRQIGELDGVQVLVAALAAVIAWVPVDQKKKVKRAQVMTADGTTIASEEEVVEVKRVDAKAREAIKGWWIATLGVST